MTKWGFERIYFFKWTQLLNSIIGVKEKVLADYMLCQHL